jgi:endonuclease-8
MPEGDSLRNIVRALSPLLVGQPVVSLQTAGTPQPGLVGQRIGQPRAHGKHLLIPVGPRAVLHVHHGLMGAWHAYPRGERWRRPRHLAEVILETPEHVLPCFEPMLVELLLADMVHHHPMLARLGPDLLEEEIDWCAVLERARVSRAIDVAGLLLDQTVAAGVGNIYKNECLFIRRLSPWTRPRDLTDDDILALLTLASERMKENVRPGLRTLTTPLLQKRTGERFWVYERRGQPCLVCTRPIQMRIQGQQQRNTFWCPSCQPAPEDPAPGLTVFR